MPAPQQGILRLKAHLSCSWNDVNYPAIVCVLEGRGGIAITGSSACPDRLVVTLRIGPAASAPPGKCCVYGLTSFEVVSSPPQPLKWTRYRGSFSNSAQQAQQRAQADTTHHATSLMQQASGTLHAFSALNIRGIDGGWSVWRLSMHVCLISAR